MVIHSEAAPAAEGEAAPAAEGEAAPAAEGEAAPAAEGEAAPAAEGEAAPAAEGEAAPAAEGEAAAPAYVSTESIDLIPFSICKKKSIQYADEIRCALTIQIESKTELVSLIHSISASKDYFDKHKKC